MASLFLFAACSGQDRYAVLLWSPDESLVQSGAVVKITNYSERKNSYSLSFASSESETGALNDVEPWRLKIAGSQSSAEAFAKENTEILGLFAASNRQALPVRSEMNRASSIVYRLREGERIKITEKSADKSDEAGLVDYWYKVLTENGTEGWVFGYQLTFDGQDRKSGSPGQTGADPLQTLVSQNWWPEYYVPMIRDKQIDLDTFQPGFKFTLDVINNKASLTLPEVKQDFSFATLINEGRNTYIAQGSTLRISFRDPSSIVVEWVESSTKTVVSKIFVLIQEDVEALYRGELDRRAGLIAKIAQASPTYTYKSENYGTLSIASDGTFSWLGFKDLEGRVIPRNSETSGTLGLKYFLARAVTGYQGALTFYFHVAGRTEEVNFLYQLGDSGLRLEYVSGSLIKNGLVQRNELNPIVLFFSI